MMSKNISIMVAAHKSYEFPSDEGYLPVHVGSVLSNSSLPIARDDAGDSISELNKSFCELTGLYWLWKNQEAEVYGVSHYRRYFKPQAGGELVAGKRIAGAGELAALLETYDVIVPRKRNYWIESVENHYANAHHSSDLVAVRDVLSSRWPEYLPYFDQVMKGRKLSLFNMFVMKREEFKSYCSWLFDVLFSLQELIDVSAYDPYQRRVFGFIAERLFNVWVLARIQPDKVKYLPVVNLEGENLIKKGAGLLRRKVKGGSVVT